MKTANNEHIFKNLFKFSLTAAILKSSEDEYFLGVFFFSQKKHQWLKTIITVSGLDLTKVLNLENILTKVYHVSSSWHPIEGVWYSKLLLMYTYRSWLIVWLLHFCLIYESHCSLPSRVPNLVSWGTVGGVALVHFTDWRLFLDYVPYIKGKFSKDE